MTDKIESTAVSSTRPKTVIERTYRARVEELWKLWTTKEGFESWWGPEGMRVEVHAIEARSGGAMTTPRINKRIILSTVRVRPCPWIS